MAGGVRIPDAVRHNDSGAQVQGPPDTMGLGQTDRRVGGHDPQHLDVTPLNRIEQVDGFHARPIRDRLRLPEPGHAVPCTGTVVVHMGGKGIGQPANFPASHGIGLAGQGKGAGAWFAHPACSQIAIDNGVAFIGSG